MNKFRQYRLLKKVDKLLNSPAPAPEIYVSSTTSRYVGDTTTARRQASHNGASLDENLKVRQVTEAIELLLRQIDLVTAETARGGGIENEQGEESSSSEFADVSIALTIKFREIEKGVLMTEAEKDVIVQRSRGIAARSLEMSKAQVDFTHDRTRLLDLQRELGAKTRKVYWVDRKLSEIGASVHDFRLAEYAKDRRKGVADLNACVRKGVALCREVEGRLDAVWCC